MGKLFESCSINKMKLPNRFIRSATWEGMADQDGAVTPKLINTMTALIDGGVGLVISSHAYVRKDGQAAPWQLGVYKDDLIPGLKGMTKAVHDKGGKIALQLSHAGQFAGKKLTGQPPYVVSDADGLTNAERTVLTEKEIQRIINAFADGARRAKQANFDGIQIHSGHGYLLSQFLSPIFNKRQDNYGGEISNRARIHLEIVQAIRNVTGDNYPILIKMNCQDFAANGLSLEDSLLAAKGFEDAGFDAIELSGGLLTNKELTPNRKGTDSAEKEAYFREEAIRFKQEIKIPIILVGGIRSYRVAGQLVEKGITDFISMSRPFIREPDLINQWKVAGNGKSECTSDNLCFRSGIRGKGVTCVRRVVNRQKQAMEVDIN